MPSPPSLRWGIDYDTDEAELDRREAYERMFRRMHAKGRVPKRMLCLDHIDRFMQTKNFFFMETHLDATVEYRLHESEDETQIYLQRDWTKAGLLCVPYRVCISDPAAHTKTYCRVRSIAQLRRAIERWECR
jgi:hypothetical protein